MSDAQSIPAESALTVFDDHVALERLVDSFMDARPVLTNWDAFRTSSESSAAVIAQLRALEPLKPFDLREHDVWVLQQRLRLALRREKGLLNEAGYRCGGCVERPVDPVLEMCLECAEAREQMPDTGSRGSCEFVKPSFDVISGKWGVLYYVSGSRDSVSLRWLALGYESRNDVLIALYPGRAFGRWRQAKLQKWFSGDIRNLVPFDSDSDESKPLSPGDFRRGLRATLLEVVPNLRNEISYAISTKLSDLSSKAREN